ncbi:MAG: LLM class flavin-dependent oxidoreductase [Nitrososphaerales archaeon]
MRFGLVDSCYPARDVVRCGIRAERCSFDSLWIPDHFTDLYPTGDRVEPWTVLSAIGAHTKTLKLGTVVTDTQRTHPARTAQAVATLDELTEGRAILGIGAGEVMNTLPYGLPFEGVQERVDRLAEAIQVIRLLWRSTREHRVSFEGRYFRLDRAVMDQRPANGAPPVYIGALGAHRTLRLVGEMGDGWIPWTNSPETFARRAREIEEAAVQAGREPGSIEMANVTSVALTEDATLQRKALDSMKAELLVTLHASVLKEMGFEPPSSKVDYKYQRVVANEAVGDLAMEAARSMPDEIARRFLVMGSASEVTEGLARFAKAGVNHIVVKDVIGMSVLVKLSETEKTLQEFHSKVIPALR